jgi:large subunit ribosomal protein L13
MTRTTAPEPTMITIDATDRTLGRVASEAAHALLGKRSVRYTPHLALPVTVVIEHAGKLRLPQKRTRSTVYKRYTGYPGGQRTATMAEVLEKKGVAEVVRKTVDGMIPRNRLRAPRMKHLIVNA